MDSFKFCFLVQVLDSERAKADEEKERSGNAPGESEKVTRMGEAIGRRGEPSEELVERSTESEDNTKERQCYQ